MKKMFMGGTVLAGAAIAGIVVLKAIISHGKNKKIKVVANKSSTKWKWVAGGIGAAYVAYVNVKRKVMLQDNFVNDNSDVESECDEDSLLSEEKEKEKLNTTKILITGANSYIGVSVENWLKKANENTRAVLYQVDTLDMQDEAWRKHDFSKYDVVYHIAGIAHADVGTVTKEQKQLYYKVNTDLAVEVAEKAKTAGVKQFVFMSSMIVYSGCKDKMITKDTVPNPLNFYGDSKWQADQKIRKLWDDSFKVVVLRPPMVYGKGSKGNYLELANLAGKLPVFPIVKNKRSMLYIDNLCQFIKLMIDNEESGVFFPQNGEYTNTSDMVQMIANVKGHRIIMLPFTNLPVKLMHKIPGKIGMLARKAFGDSAYDMSMSIYKENYQIHRLMESVQLTEEGEADV